MEIKDIKVGYEVGTGNQIDIKASHLIVTGVTQLSGKTTTLEALIKRSGFKAIVFKTKIGEKSFTDGIETPPFFRDRSDYEFVRSLIEAYSKEKLGIEKGSLMVLCKGSTSLIEIKRKVDEIISEGKLRGIKEEIHIRLQHYLENLIPQIQHAKLSKTLNVSEGINIMNLERFSEEAQSLIIQSVADEVLKTMTGIIIVIPEAWKFIPQKYNNPCKRVIESFIRQGATNNNFIWIDSQDMAGVDKAPLKQISTWILGYQSERNEVKHTLDQIALPQKSKPKEDEIMNLKTGHFIVSSYDGVVNVYIQPSWLEDDEAIEVAKGNKSVKDIKSPDNLVPNSIAPIQSRGENTEIKFDDSNIRKQLIEIRQDFFNKIEDLQTTIQNIYSEISDLKLQKQEMNVDEVISLVLQKMPSQTGTSINKDEIISEVLARVPKSSGSTVYEVAPLEKIKKDFLQDAKDKIVTEVMSLDDEQKKILAFIESQNKGCTQTHILSKCLYVSATSGGTRARIATKCKEMANLEIVRMDKNSVVYAMLKDRIRSLTEVYEATNEDIEQVYNHILAEIIL